MILPNIPRLYTALAEVLAMLLYARRLPRRFHRQTAVTVVWALVLGIFLHKTGYVPLAWWVPCMLCAVLLLYGYLWGSREVNWLEALYITARAFLLAEFAASAEWQLHCWLIRTAVYAQNGFVLFRVENYCQKPVELGADGLPLRSAHGGYDLRSLRAAAQQHGGSMTVHWEDGWFTLRVLLPQAGIQQTEGGE